MTRRDFLFEQLSSPQAPAKTTAGELSIRVAGLPILLRIADAAVLDEMQHYFARYLSGEAPRAEITIGTLSSDGRPTLWEDEDAEFDIRGAHVVHRDFAARREGRAATAWINAEVAHDAAHNLLRWFLPDPLLDEGCLLLHGAGIAKDGKGYAFFGKSGAGKSTTTGLIAGADPRALILGDDAVIIGMDGNSPWLHSAPLGSGYSREAPPPESIPLEGLYALEQSGETRIESLSSSQGVGSLLASAMCLSFGWRADDRMDLAQRFAASPCGVRKLKFQKTAAFWSQITENKTDADT